MRRWLGVIVLAIGWTIGNPSNPPRAAEPDKPLRVLFIVAGHGGEQKAPILDKLFDELGGFQVTRLKQLPDLAQVKRADYDVLLFYGGPQANELQERAIEQFVDEGGGVVALHHASANPSKAWIQLIGARFAGHPPISNTEAIVIDAQHPITAGVEPKFTLFDESYKHKMADVQKQVLLRLKDRPGDKTPDPNTDIVWTREVGKGRVVYNALGHGPEAWTNPNWQKLVVQSLYWAAGRPRAVKLPASK
ncbi:MAG: ThuA domain-containing protein [Gemmataceae bacterium]